MQLIGAVPWALLVMLGVGEPPVEQQRAASPLQVYPLPAGLVLERVSVGADESATATAGVDEKLVYSNNLGNWVVPLPANTRFADDLTLAIAGSCRIRRIEFPVVGKVDPAGAGGPYTVTVRLYSKCPGSVPSNLLNSILISGSAYVFPLSDDAPHLISLPFEGLLLPENATSFWLAIAFNRANAGFLAGAPASKGQSCDLYDFPSPGAQCNGWFGGFPGHPYGAMNVEVFGEAECSDGFPGYKANRPAQGVVNFGAGTAVLDDIHLDVESCRMTAFEVAVKGSGLFLFELRNHCDSAAIPGTTGFLGASSGSGSSTSVLLRRTFNPPIQIPRDFVFSASVNDSTAGVVLAGNDPCVGSTQDTFFMIEPGSAECVSIPSPIPGQKAALNLTITCAGQPPVGACCDMFFPDENDEPVCRDVPRMNCAYSSLYDPESNLQPDWVEGGSCNADPFPHPCGVAACCRPDYGCENLTANQCFALEPLDRPRQWQRGRYCGFAAQQCPYIDCLARVGDCSAPHEGGGCFDPECCDKVCDTDDFCCRVEWDRVCVELAAQLCDTPSDHDFCWNANPQRGALEIAASGQTVFSNSRATGSESDPPFECLVDGTSRQGQRTVWFKFVATHDSVTIDATASEAEDDSMIQVFAVGDPTTEETACASLQPIGCGDDVRGCVVSSSHPRFCVTGLSPGTSYYLLLAQKAWSAPGTHLLDLLSPCSSGTGDCDNDGVLDECELDCNSNAHPDKCDVIDGRSPDCNKNSIPDECDPDCNANDAPDDCDIASGTSADCDSDTLPDECFSETFQLGHMLEYPTYPWWAAITQDFLAVGGYGFEVFRRDGAQWLLVEDFVGRGRSANFLAASGDWLLAGHVEGFDWTYYGVAAFYHWNGIRWETPFESLDPAGYFGSYRGYALAGDIDGDVSAVSGPYDSSYFSPQAVHLFYRAGSSWMEHSPIPDPEPDEAGDFASALALDDYTLAVARTYPARESHPPTVGRIYIYHQAQPSEPYSPWVREATIVSPDGATQSRFGARLDLEGDTLVVGDQPSEGGEYQVRVFRRTEDDWSLETRLTAQPPYEQVALGTSVSIRNGRIAVTPVEPGQDDPIVYIFERTATGWQNTLRWSDPERPPDHPSTTFVTAVGTSNVVVAQAWSESGQPIIDLFPVKRLDCNANHRPDVCETGGDCNGDGVFDACQSLRPFDSDFDGDTDLRDVASMLACFTGAGGASPGVCCKVFDEGPDQDVDAADWAAFRAAMNGPGRP